MSDEAQRTVNWYPGHMARAKRLLADQLRSVDVAIELCDARLPFSSRNPDLDALIGGKSRLLLMNKADLADEAATARWLSAFREKGIEAAPLSATKGRPSDVTRLIEKAARARVERAAARGIKKIVRCMVVGVPNVGKSTVINRLKGASVARVGDRPGVTRANQWVRVGDYLELLDTPGLLWPKLQDQTAARRLSYIAAIRDDSRGAEWLAAHMLEELLATYPQRVLERYKLTDAALKGQALIEAAALGRGFLMRGGEPDTLRLANVALDEFRAGRLGRVTLERAP